MKHKQSYHTNVISAFKLGFLDSSTLSLIPRSTQYYFKNKDISHLIGFDLYNDFDDKSKLFKELLKSHKIFVFFKAVIKIKNAIISINSSLKNKFDKIKLVVDTIDNVKCSIGLDRALAFFRISRNQFFSWSFKVKHKCSDSFSGFCVKSFPNQISLSTINKIKSVCSDPFYKGWPISSIAYYCRRENIINIALSTWYKYSHILNISRKTHKCLKKYRVGIRASSPNQIWHADITVFRTNDNIKSYIYLIVDNFSRKIISWKVSLSVSAQIRFESIKDAYDKYLRDHESPPSTDLLVDGGCENNNVLIDDFLSGEDIPIRKIIAQKDIIFSNSIVEAVNKTLKYRLLFLQDIPDFDSLVKHLDRFIPIYNDIRPHISLGGLTPSEAFSGKSVSSIFPKLNSVSSNAKIHDTTCTACSI